MSIKTLRNESGVVLFSVLAITMILMVLALGLVSRVTSQMIVTQKQINLITAEQIAQGLYWQLYTDLTQEGSDSDLFDAGNYDDGITLNDRSYQTSIVQNDAGDGKFTYTIIVDYN